MTRTKRNLLMKPYFLKGNTGILTLNNFGGLVIKIDEDGDGLQYQYNFGNNKPDKIERAEIQYFEDTNNCTGYAEEEDGLLQAGFITLAGETWFLGEFMRSDY